MNKDNVFMNKMSVFMNKMTVIMNILNELNNSLVVKVNTSFFIVFVNANTLFI